MTAGSAARLYTPQILSLAVELGSYPFDESAGWSAMVRSRSCGSTLAMSLTADGAGNLDVVGMTVTACAIGQAAAAIFASTAPGKRPHELANYHDEVRNWLNGSSPLPNWPRLELLEDARAFAGRHEAILLPWKAASEALCNASTSG